MMLVLLLCVIMKIAEYSVGRASPTLPVPARPLLAPCCNKRKRHDRHFYRKPNDTLKYIQQKRAGKGVAVMDDPQTPGSDCNSNPASDSITQDLINSEFVQDNVEYQWFIDYGYRDGGLHVHPSVLSSLSASYTRDDLGYYDDLSRNLDVNLAEVDMESFRTADIHTLLTALPVMCTDPIQHSEFNYERERFASISGSDMEKLDIGSSISPHTSSQGEDSACSTTDTISICKSSLLFSPLKETPVLPPGGSYSVDSLDCEDMLLTCQANNKNNYTIAFEGSITMYSDGSQDFDTQDKQQKAYEAPEPYCTEKIDLKNILDLSMACSDSKIYTTWSNLKHSATNKIMSRHPSGNNNTIPNFLQGPTLMFNTNKRSQSLPDLTQTRQLQQVNVPLNFSVDSAESNNQPANLESSTSAMSRSVNEESSSSVGNPSNGGKKLQNLSLVRLFMKQKSMSAEGMSLTLDQSDSASDSGWPTSNSDSGTNTNTNTQIQRKNLNRTENDFSINWVKPDYYLTETQTTGKKSIKEESEHKEETLTSSVSIEELSESQMSKSDLQKEFHVLHNSIDNRRFNLWSSPLEAGVCQSRTTTGVQAKTEVEDNQVQTSLIYPPDKVFPSWKETCIDKKPIYVVYPNYALPDLSFLNSKEVEMRNVSLKPQSFENKEKSNLGNAAKGAKNGRPFSCNDLDALKQRGFSHVEDWESLTFLLPLEYKKVLHDVPELSKHINLNEMKKPLFCLSPPMKHRRPVSGEINNRTSTSSTSSSATPSSGYRGSSTMLSDSSTNRSQTNPLYLYRYDSVSSEASLMGQKKPVNQRTNATRIPSLPKRSISLPHGTDKEGAGDFHNVKVPPRPPLPRSILRKNRTPSKRYSMFEMGMGNVEEVTDQLTEKRKSLQEPYYINNDLHLLKNGRIVDSDKDIDEVEERLKETEKARYESDVLESSEDDMRQLEEFLKRSGFSSQSSDDNDDPDIKLRSYVRKFLALKMNKDLIKNVEMIDSQKKTVSFAVNQRRKYLDNKISNFNVTPCNQNKETVITEDAIENNSDVKESSLEDKKKMMASINQAVELLLKYWHTEPNRNRLSNSEKNECAQLCLSNLCPAIYALMSNGLRPHLNSTFGPIANNVWKVVEASSQQGPLTKTLNELVQKINGEDFMTEGMLKFHAFVFGLLNLRALDAWFAYLCTRESILRKHYTSNSLFVAALSSVNARKTVDGFLDILQPLAFCPFQIDLLYQYRQLHNSFGNLTTNALMSPTFRTPDLCGTEHVEHRTTTSPSKMRPRSCGYNYEDLQKPHLELNNAKKRLSTPPLNSKLFHALERFTSEDSEEYTDSLEHSPLNRATPKKANQNLGADDETQTAGEAKFRKLQEKWELMGKEEREHQQSCLDSPPSPVKTPSSAGKSKIPRLLTSPVKQPNSSAKGSKNSPVTGIPSLKKPAMLPAKTPPKKPGDLRQKEIPRRTSRVDQDNVGTARPHLTRPSSLPYKTQGIVAKDKSLVSPHRRAASTSLPRSTATAAKHSAVKQPLKVVRTLSHRLPSDNGHLAFNEGEKLKVILEVDAKWLLCAKGDRKGLVPRACVHAVQT